eukprot:403377463
MAQQQSISSNTLINDDLNKSAGSATGIQHTQQVAGNVGAFGQNNSQNQMSANQLQQNLANVGLSGNQQQQNQLFNSSSSLLGSGSGQGFNLSGQQQSVDTKSQPFDISGRLMANVVGRQIGQEVLTEQISNLQRQQQLQREERERLEQLRRQKEIEEQQRIENERLEKLRQQELLRKEQERLEIIRQQEIARKEQERLEQERLAKLEKERKERELLEKLRQDQERVKNEKDRMEQIRIEKERQERIRLEQIRLEEEERQRVELLRIRQAELEAKQKLEAEKRGASMRENLIKLSVQKEEEEYKRQLEYEMQQQKLKLEKEFQEKLEAKKQAKEKEVREQFAQALEQKRIQEEEQIRQSRQLQGNATVVGGTVGSAVIGSQILSGNSQTAGVSTIQGTSSSNVFKKDTQASQSHVTYGQRPSAGAQVFPSQYSSQLKEINSQLNPVNRNNIPMNTIRNEDDVDNGEDLDLSFEEQKLQRGGLKYRENDFNVADRLLTERDEDDTYKFNQKEMFDNAFQQNQRDIIESLENQGSGEEEMGINQKTRLQIQEGELELIALNKEIESLESSEYIYWFIIFSVLAVLILELCGYPLQKVLANPAQIGADLFDQFVTAIGKYMPK